MKALVHEARIALSEWLLRCARCAMPADAPEAAALTRHLADYANETAPIKRWEKFPA